MANVELRSFRFRTERERSWRLLARIIDRVEREGFEALTAREVADLPVLYRTAVSSLSVARSISLDQNVLGYLENLAARGYLCVYRPKRRLGEAAAAFFGRDLPALVWGLRWYVAFALAVVAAGLACGMALVLSDPDQFYALVGDGLGQGRSPTTPPEELRSILYQGGSTARSELAAFAAFLFSHNARIGIFAFALGFLGGIPAIMLLFYNGLALGAVGALYHRVGLAVDFWAWIAGHGVTEILAVGLCGGAGLGLARAIIFPARFGRLHELASTGRRMASVVVGAVVMFLCAAVLEGFFRQLVGDPAPRYIMGGATLVFWVCYFAQGRRFRP